ncbi:Gfo/Idh/MocA family oxidoreductase [Alicyclobacillus curvatus]|nr:Gfo/Idh/MocA family oxidoreductase [Alicyclobacillus curvatus]
MIRVALLSKWHVHADDYAGQAKRNENVEIKLVWDEQAERGAKWAEALGVAFEADLDKVLTNPEIDAVIVTTPTNAHYALIMAAIRAGKHVFTEKVLAFTRQECLDILHAAKDADVNVMVSLPRLTDAYYVVAQDALDRGLLGNLTSVRCRLAHNGAVPTEQAPSGWLPAHFFDAELCGGGALIDLGAHPIYLTNRLAGQPTAVSARFSSYLDKGVDDNSVVLVEYESGALGIIEAGFVAGRSPFSLEMHGTEGSVLVEDSNLKIKSRKLPEDRWYLVDNTADAQVLSQYFPVHHRLPMPMEQWVQSITDGIEPSITAYDVIGLTAINEAAAASNATASRVTVAPFEA